MTVLCTAAGHGQSLHTYYRWHIYIGTIAGKCSILSLIPGRTITKTLIGLVILLADHVLIIAMYFPSYVILQCSPRVILCCSVLPALCYAAVFSPSNIMLQCSPRVMLCCSVLHELCYTAVFSPSYVMLQCSPELCYAAVFSLSYVMLQCSPRVMLCCSVYLLQSCSIDTLRG